MNQPLLSFTPSALPKETLEELFVAREPLLTRLEASVDHLAAGAAHHTLLVGPRGIGKTHLTSMLYHRVKARNSSAVAWLREDPWGLRSYEQLVDQLADAVRREDGTAVVGRHPDRASAEASLAEAVGDRKLLVLIENFVDVLSRIKLSGQLALRALLQNSGSILLVATSPSLGSDVTKQAAPFYGFFDTIRLEELTLDEASELLVKVAALRGDQALVEFLSTDTARRRLKVVEALAGGHPRVWMLLANCMSIETIDELVPVFLKALDDLTPYYQDRMRELPQQQESIVFELCEHRLPLTVGDIARRCGLLQNAASVQIRELVDKGYLRKLQTSGGDRRKSYYELREPLMRICLDVKESRGEPLRLIVEFLRDWYGIELFDLRLVLTSALPLAQLHVNEAITALLTTIKASDDVSIPRQLAQGCHVSALRSLSHEADSESMRFFALAYLFDCEGLQRCFDGMKSLEEDIELLDVLVQVVADARAVVDRNAKWDASDISAAFTLAVFRNNEEAAASYLLSAFTNQIEYLRPALLQIVMLSTLCFEESERKLVTSLVRALGEADEGISVIASLSNVLWRSKTDVLVAQTLVPTELRPIVEQFHNLANDAEKVRDVTSGLNRIRTASERGDRDPGVPEGDAAAPVGEGVVGQ